MMSIPSSRDHIIMISHSAGLSTKLDNGHDRSITFLNQDKTLQGWGLVYLSGYECLHY